MGYARAGFDVTGIDLHPQPHYQFRFIQGDALQADLAGYDAIHASPPCQRFSVTQSIRQQEERSYPDLVAATRSYLATAGVPTVMENVITAPMRRDLVLCGTQFGLTVLTRTGRRELRRHRAFELGSWWTGELPPPCNHRYPSISVAGHGGGSLPHQAHWGMLGERRAVMQMDWCERDELAEAIPPAYTEWIGKQLLGWLT
jgi:DNA (cytosine-5)-methyltransferase 1